MSDCILVKDLGEGVALMTLNRAPVNALNPAYLTEIASRLTTLENDACVRAVVITSAFKVFSAGMDLKEAMNFDLVGQTAAADGLNNTFAKLYGFPKPVVAAVNGSALAGGMFFVLAADYSVVREGIKLGLTEIRVGVRFPVGPLEIARDTLPPGAFRRLLLSGQPLEASRAVELGFVDEVSAPDKLMARAEAVARTYAALPPRTFAAVKAQMRAPALKVIEAAIEGKSDPAHSGWFTDETIPAMTAMLDATRK